MNDKTPKRTAGGAPNNSGFSPITLHESPATASPQKNLTGIARVARDLTADLYNNIQKWNDLHIKGSTIVKQVASLKADNGKNFTSSLEDLTTELFGNVNSLSKFRDNLQSIHSQMRALSKLQKQPGPVFISLDANSLARLVGEITSAYEDELKMKEFVLENVAHLRNKSEAMFYAALWTYQTKITENVERSLEVLLLETGHRKIS